MTFPLTTAQAAQRAWQIRRLTAEGAVDRVAAFTALDTLYRHPNPRVQRLCVTLAEKIPRPAPIAEPAVESAAPGASGAR